MLYRREWGRGQPVIALHPLGLDSSAFAGFGRVLAAHGIRTVGVDLPGFGRTAYPREPLTPARLARPVIEMAARMRSPPVVLGISLGGRVALECAFAAPELFRSVIAIAPYMPWIRYRRLLQLGVALSPEVAERLRLELAWPVLRPLAWLLQFAPYLRDDELAQSGARLIYYASCPATRASFVSAARELALDPPRGAEGFYSRLERLAIPATFVWGGRDRLVTSRFAGITSASLPSARQLVLPCLAHALNGPHHRCLARAVALVLARVADAEGADPTRCQVSSGDDSGDERNRPGVSLEV